MAYIGKIPGGTAISNRILDSMTGDGSTNTLTLSETPNSVMDVAIYCNGVMQRPGTEYTLAGNTITFTSTPANGVFICALTGGSENVGSPAVNSITTDKLVNGVVTDAKISGTVSSSKISGALPALDGSSLTGLASAIDTLSTNNPAIDTNPATGVGTLWTNTTTGQIFVCTDATTDANTWTNVGAGSGDVVPYSFQGAVSGYSSGGDSTGSTFWNTIDKFEFASNTTAADHGDLTVTRAGTSGQNSATNGYTAGGVTLPGYVKSNVIDKFAFASNVTAEDHGDLTVARQGCSGQSSSTHGFASGGQEAGGANSNIMDKFATASNVTASDHGDLAAPRNLVAGQSSETHGFVSGGDGNSGRVNTIDKFAFTSNVTASDHGDLIQARYSLAGHQY